VVMGRINPQLSLDDITWREQIPKNSFWHEMYEFGMKYMDENDFALLYSHTGRPSYSPVQMMLALMLQFTKSYSDREFEEASRFDDRVKYALLDGRDFKGIDAVTLCDFRTRLLTSDEAMLLLEKTLQIAEKVGLIKGKNLNVIDSFIVHGAAARQDTYTMIRAAIRRVLCIARLHELEGHFQLWLQYDDYDVKGKPKIDWNDDEAKRQLLESLVRDGMRIVTASNQLDLKVVPTDLAEAIKLLKRVVLQDVTIDEKGRVAMLKGTAEDRVISVNDPEMRHGRKTTSAKADGYKAHIITTGEQGELIAAVEVTAANVADKEPLAGMLDALDESDRRPEEILGDSAYYDPEEAAAQAVNGTIIVAKVPPASNKESFFSKDEFQVDLTNGTVACPAGQIANFDKGRLDQQERCVARFEGEVCMACPLYEQCTNSKSGRTVSIHPHEEKIQHDRAEQRTEAFKDKYRQRSTVERDISHLTRNGARKARYIGINKIMLQQVVIAIAHNARKIAKKIISVERVADELSMV
jgi:transposase